MAPSITEDDFLTWRENPVTRWVFRAIELATDAQREDWIVRSWENGIADPAVLIELRVRADAYRALYETSYPAWREMHESAEA